jgi:uncharacterized protein (TIGR00255 family)
MILSMTGYGSGAAQKDGATVTVEIRTVNHRFLDLHVRVPREYLFLEGEIQQMVRNALDRGRVDVSAVIQNAVSGAPLVDAGLVKGYLEAAAGLKEEFHFQDSLDLKTVLGLPGVLQNREGLQAGASEALMELARLAVAEALDGVRRMRFREGEALRADMLKNLDRIETAVRRIGELGAKCAAEQFEKLRGRLEQLLPGGAIDPQRLAQEAALLADKCDISEEVARLESHIGQYRSLVDAEEKAGKKLDFLLQELQREANTILSKSGNLDISRHAIALKADIEKLREQVQNVE